MCLIPYVCMYLSIYVRTYARTYACVYAKIHTYVHACMHRHIPEPNRTDYLSKNPEPKRIEPDRFFPGFGDKRTRCIIARAAPRRVRLSCTVPCSN